MTRSEANYIAILLEDMNGKFQFVVEAVSDIQRIVKNQPTREEFEALLSKVDVTIGALKATNRQVHDHEKRITQLEARS